MAAATALTVALLGALSTGFAGPARAEPVMQGVYTYTQDGAPPQTFTVYPSCVPVVGDLREPLELAVACRLHVATSGGIKGGDARLADGKWTYSTAVLEGLQCSNGTWAPITETYRFDDVAMTGVRSVSNDAVCGLAPAVHTFPFTLAYQGPLPFPVETYPLDCENWGLRLCT